MNRATIAASTAASLVAAACGGGAAQVAEPSPGVVPEPAHSPALALPVTEAVPEATTTTATSQPPGQARIEVAAVEPPEPVELDDDEWWERESLLNCIRSHEQGAAGYATETGNGYHGGYQFDQATWDGAVERAGYPEWVGRPAGDAPDYVQDDAAWQLFLERGLNPWPTPQAVC